jgi:DNA-binding response OmpR family regulator
MTRIVVVDDQACVRRMVSDELGAEGYRVETAADIESLRGYLRFMPPDVVVLDLFLDDGHGLEILREIKGQCPRLPVIIFTAYDTYREDARSAGADDYVIKSMFLDELKEKIACLLGFYGRPKTGRQAVGPVSGIAAIAGF